MTLPDWNSRTGRIVRACEVPEPALEGRCGCNNRAKGQLCVLLEGPQGCSGPSCISDKNPWGCTGPACVTPATPKGCELRTDIGVCDCPRAPCECPKKPCDCIDFYPPCDCILSAGHRYTVNKWVRLLELFDPDEYKDPDLPPAKSLMLSHGDEVRVMSDRFGPPRQEPRGRRLKGRYKLRHPDDVTARHEAADEVSVQGRKGRKEGELKTNQLSPLERTLLEILEAQVLPAYLMWPWRRAGEDHLPAAARALQEIRDRHLHREVSNSFNEYAMTVFQFQPMDLDTIFAAGEPTVLSLRKAA